MAHFETHIVSAVQSTARDAQATLDAELAKVAETHVTAARSDFLAGLADREPDLYKSVEGQLDDLDARMAALREDPAGAAATPVDAAPATALTTWAEQRQKHAETLLATEDPEKKDALGSEKAELEARLTLAARLPDAESWVITLARVRKLEAAKTALATNRITSKQREMAEGLVTEDFKAQLTAEMERLSCALPVDLDPSTSVGETQVTLRLAGAHGTPKVSDIASEGEHRAVSLAFFLAEVGLAGGDGGIVVDDPVSSLDDLRREYIAERLVAESQHRQVIVFTHDLPFVHDLLGEAKKVGIEPAVRGIWSMGDVVGLVDEAPPFKAMRFRARVGKLTETVEHWDDQDPPRDQDEAWSRVRGLYADMRSTWERGVEERLFRGVVARFQRSVKTQSLSEVNFTAEHIEMVEAGMTRCSLFAHDEPMPAAVSLPGRAQLATDVEALRDFEKATRAS